MLWSIKKWLSSECANLHNNEVLINLGGDGAEKRGEFVLTRGNFTMSNQLMFGSIVLIGGSRDGKNRENELCGDRYVRAYVTQFSREQSLRRKLSE